MDSDAIKTANILADNADKNFVDRIINKDKYPTLPNQDGSHSTHSMAWGEADGKYHVFPTVIQGADGNLERLSGDDAWKHAHDTGEFIEFNPPEKADSFSRDYKKVWK